MRAAAAALRKSQIFYDWVIYAQSMTQSPKSPNDCGAAAGAAAEAPFFSNR